MKCLSPSWWHVPGAFLGIDRGQGWHYSCQQESWNRQRDGSLHLLSLTNPHVTSKFFWLNLKTKSFLRLRWRDSRRIIFSEAALKVTVNHFIWKFNIAKLPRGFQSKNSREFSGPLVHKIYRLVFQLSKTQEAKPREEEYGQDTEEKSGHSCSNPPALGMGWHSGSALASSNLPAWPSA